LSKMAPGITEASWVGTTGPVLYKGEPRNIKWIEAIKWDESLRTKQYHIYGTHPDSKILFLDVNILDSTGKDPYPGDVYIEGELLSITRRMQENLTD
jgi:hypothetical protein